MSLTLGEKLRQAREERGITISEVAEQTRIAPLYIESIEENDYKPLPGGIFNKGFVKSYARYVGVDEQEALADYARLISEQEGQDADEPKTYRPEVLTDERASGMRLSTIVFAIIILGLMTWGIYSLAMFIERGWNAPTANTNTANLNTNTNQANTNSDNTNAAQPLPATDRISIELKAVGEDVWLNYTADGKNSSTTVTPAEPLKAEAKDSVRISYHRDKSQNVQLTLNGKQITPPSPPAKGNVVIEINKANIAQILQSGQISTGDANNPNTTAPR